MEGLTPGEMAILQRVAAEGRRTMDTLERSGVFEIARKMSVQNQQAIAAAAQIALAIPQINQKWLGDQLNPILLRMGEQNDAAVRHMAAKMAPLIERATRDYELPALPSPVCEPAIHYYFPVRTCPP